MPDRPVWLDRLPEILHELRGIPDCQDLLAKDVAELLGIKTRATQMVLAAAGAKQEIPGGPYTATADQLRRYLLSRAPANFEQDERRRRARIAAALTDGIRHLAGHPDKFRQIGVLEDLIPVSKRSFGALPEKVELGPGYITVRFERVEDGLMALMQLCIAASQDFEELEMRVQGSRREEGNGGSLSTAEGEDEMRQLVRKVLVAGGGQA